MERSEVLKKVVRAIARARNAVKLSRARRCSSPGAFVYYALKGEHTAVALDAFVAETDRRGHIGSADVEAYWAGVAYQRSTRVNESLDPYSSEYVEQQLALYRELSGRNLDQTTNELTEFTLRDHVVAANPYAHQAPVMIGIHLARLSHALMHSKLQIGDHLLDMGCGWGLSSEIFAYSGLRVTALDINPRFVELVEARAREKNLPIQAIQGTFEKVPPGPFDAVAYYECLHHAVKPWETLTAVAGSLRLGGKLLLAGEPINEMWRHWGLRTDPLSIYCIRKFGWFESGWSIQFLCDCIEKCGFKITHCTNEGLQIGWVIVAEKI